MSPWKWTPERTQGIWRHGPAWMKPLVAAVPWLTVLLLLLMLHMVGGTFVTNRGALFDLPDSNGLEDGENASLVALVMPMPHETLVFFDDARYTIGNETSAAAFVSHLEDRVSKSDRKKLLVLADRRVATGELMKIAAMARRSGVGSVLFAEKRAGKVDE